MRTGRPFTFRLAIAGVAVAAVGLAAPVASAPPAVAYTAGQDACDLLRRSEIERVLGKPAAAPEGLDDSCSWAIADPATPEGMTIVATIDRGSQARAAFREGREVLRPDVLVEVDGLGKDAYFAVSTIAVLKNKKTVVYLGGIFDQEQAEELVRLALRRA